ncbi:MAG: DUF4248 domain-containing protein [Parabacteroides gordonii]|nr:DUF4248 domain-containing protein [Parabacteroides gordonii]
MASEKLRRWINESGNLKDKLLALDWKPGKKLLTPRQSTCIFDHLGEP